MSRKSVLLAGCTSLATLLASAAPAAASTAAETGNTLEEIVVTAQKREQSLKDVPGAVTAISQETLLARGATTIADISAFVPGLNVGSGTGGTTIVIRGINTGSDAAAASGVTIDGAPIGSSSSFVSGSSTAFDLEPSDIRRVEVLRGPQGTLYGASTLGGLVAYVTRRPGLSGFDASAGGEVAATHGGDGSHEVRGALDGPILKDKLGLRISAFEDVAGGFIDDNLTHRKNIDTLKRDGARISLFAKPTDRVSLSLWAADQRTTGKGESLITTDNRGAPLTGDLAYDQFVAPSHRQNVKIVYGAVDWDLGSTELDYIGTTQHIETTVALNYSNASLISTLRLLGALGLGPQLPSPAAATLTFDLNLDKTSHEVRLSSKSNGPLTWILGGFYTVEHGVSSQTGQIRTAAGTPVSTLDPFLRLQLATDYREYAGFGNVSYAFTPRLQATLGLRVGEDRQHFQQFTTGADVPGLNAVLTKIYGPAAAFVPATPRSGSNESVTTYLADAKYQLTDDVTGYLRFATGYRPGGPNVNAPGASPTFHSDSVRSFESGLKAETADRTARIDVAAFYVDWSDIQVARSVNGISSRANAGAASSRGLELTGAWLPVEGLTVGTTIAYTDAHLDENAPDVGGVKGDALPTSPKWAGSLTADYVWPVSGGLRGVLSAVGRFAGDRHTSFPGSAGVPDIRLRSYVTADLRAGVETQNWEITGFVRNLLDERAELAGRSGAGLNEVTVARPRTIGMAFTWRR